MPSGPRDEIKIDEVLRPRNSASASRAADGKATEDATSEVARVLARWLDERLRIPGTNFRIGLDPLLALIPGIGDFLASGSGFIILAEAVRCGVSIPVLMRMGGNMLVNTLLDVIPVVGPVASAFFKSNTRNFRLLQRWQEGQQRAVRKSTLRLFIALGFFVLMLLGLVVGLWVFYFWLFSEFFGPGVGRWFGR